VKVFTSEAILAVLSKFPGTVLMPSRNPHESTGDPNKPPKATYLPSELMTRARRPRARHHVKPLNVS